MKKVGVAILGLGVVGGGTYKILTDNKEYFKHTQNIDISVENVLEKNMDRVKSLGIDPSVVASSIEEVISNPAVDIVVEVIGGTLVARDFVLKALKSGKTVVTSNKELFSKYWCELEAAAKETDAGLLFEATCMGGVPIIRTLIDGMQANKIQTIKGIINGTTNYILSKMSEQGSSYEEALAEAQKLGFAEFNPTADVEGFDSSYKLSILSSLAFDTKVAVENVHREGITGITKEDIAYGKKMGYAIKLLGIGKRTENGIEVRVHPTYVSEENPLAQVKGPFNSISVVGDAVGEIMLYGRGAGALPTGSAIVSDVIYAAKHLENFYAPFDNTPKGASATKFAVDFNSQYFVRLTVKDQVGVLSKISGIFGKNGISIKEVKQCAESDGKVTVVFISHQTAESVLNKALEKVKELNTVCSIDSVIRLED